MSQNKKNLLYIISIYKCLLANLKMGYFLHGKKEKIHSQYDRRLTMTKALMIDIRLRSALLGLALMWTSCAQSSSKESQTQNTQAPNPGSIPPPSPSSERQFFCDGGPMGQVLCSYKVNDSTRTLSCWDQNGFALGRFPSSSPPCY